MLNTLASIYQGGAGGAGGSFESIATATGTGSSGTIRFNSIPSTYKHLQIRGIARITYTSGIANSSPIGLTLNNAGTYSKHRLYGDGTSALSSGNSSVGDVYIGNSANNDTTSGVVGVFIVDILDYTNTSKYKTIKSFAGVNNNTSSTNYHVDLYSGAINSSLSAVSSIELFDDNGYNFDTTTQFALYGIKG